MKFLIKIEDAINRLLTAIFDKIVSLIPSFVFEAITFTRHLPLKIILFLSNVVTPKLRVVSFKTFGFIKYCLTIIFGIFTSAIIYLRSDEFRKANKKELCLTPLRYAKTHPYLALLNTTVVFGFVIGSVVVFNNTNKIVKGTKALRGPASVEVEADVHVDFKNITFEVEIGKSGSDTESGNLVLDISLETANEKDRQYLEKMEETFKELFKKTKLKAEQLPLSAKNQKEIEQVLQKSIEEALASHGQDNLVKALAIKQIPPGRPIYYGKIDRIVYFKDVNLQIFLEETKRNRQVYIDFTVVASNRYTALFVRDNEVEIKDLLNVNVEPILHKLMLEEEGRAIIKDKIRDELNEYIKARGIEGRIQEIYIDSVISS